MKNTNRQKIKYSSKCLQYFPTKAQPKEKLPIVDKPTIQYIIEEGIEDILIITGRNKRSIEDNLDKSVELEMTLEQKGKSEQED